jgi:TonB family protein
MTTRIICVAVAAVLIGGRTAAAQDALAQAKTLYAAANYADALKLLDSAAGAATTEARQYRALCFLALGQTAEAEREAAAVVEADPFFKPDEDEVAPRVIDLFAGARRKLLPSIIRTTFDDAKLLFSAGHRERARARFEDVLRLLDDPVLETNTVLADLKIVAAGFVDLAASTPAPAPPVLQAAREPAPAAAPAAAVARVTVIPAESIQQTLPSWQPRDPFASGRDFVGAVRVVIDETGRVATATIERSIHPEYDRLLLAATARWRYKPATQNGVQVPSDKVVEIRLRTK